MLDTGSSSLDNVVHVIQLSLTPIFLLTAMASLLSVFTTRLARVSDQVKAVADKCEGNADIDATTRRRLAFLRQRSLLLDGAVILGAVSGAFTCVTVLTLFLGILRTSETEGILFVMFGLAILCIIGALGLFLFEVLLASRGIREAVDANVRRVEF